MISPKISFLKTRTYNRYSKLTVGIFKILLKLNIMETFQKLPIYNSDVAEFPMLIHLYT